MKAMVHRLSNWVADAASSLWAFPFALAIVLTWLVSGPIVGYSDSWMLWINTFTTIVTFLIGFVILFTQRRNDRALHLKLDEIIRATTDARNELMRAEKMPEAMLRSYEREFGSEQYTGAEGS